MRVLLLLLLAATAAADTITGTVTGLLPSKFVVLKAGTATLTASNGPFTMNGTLPITIGIQPSGQLCTVSGTTIVCQSAYSISGTISGLDTGSMVVLMNNSSLLIPVGATSFKFAALLTTGTPYAVRVGIAPSGRYCEVKNGAGTIAQANITNPSIQCQPYATANVTWTRPMFNTDGTPLTDLTSYKLYYGTDPALVTYAVRLVSSSALSTTFTTLKPNVVYYFAISSVSASGGEGPRSNTASTQP